jgi:uncharacterized protein YpmB
MPDNQEPRQQAGNRMFSCLLIAAIFIIIDLAILLYFFLPTRPVDKASETGQSIQRQQQAASGNAAATVESPGE